MRQMYFDRQGRPITPDRWIELFDDRSYQVVVQEEKDEVRVSTIWLGLDHSFGLGGPPLIFETMIFGGTRDGDQWRYESEEGALSGHALACIEAFDLAGSS